MKSYTINLKRSIERRAYVNSELSKIPFIDNEFIEGIEGRNLSQNELLAFHQEIAKDRYGRNLKLGEIGCTLSHRKCYESFLDTDYKALIIFEDDIAIRNAKEKTWNDLYDYVANDETPTVILLSGGYWRKGKFQHDSIELARVYSAYYTHSYIINRAAAQLMLSISPDYLADDWRHFKKHGLRLLAAYPHIVDQQWDGSVPSMIQNEAKSWFSTLPIRYKIKSYLKIIPCKVLELLGLHERDSFENFSQI